jgi:hypothetical protein
MPYQYEEIKKKFLAQGMSNEEAEQHAARIYNANRPQGAPPVGPHSDRADQKPRKE